MLVYICTARLHETFLNIQTFSASGVDAQAGIFTGMDARTAPTLEVCAFLRVGVGVGAWVEE